MFSNLIFRNSRRSRKENGLFFSALVTSIVAFYMILSISTQDVMRFLQKMESDAVDRLLLLIPVFYGMTLVILFFLIYFACKYQFERRRHEFGVYLMLGMHRKKLFLMLLLEDLLSSVVALVIGLPVAVILSEVVSLVTAKLVGMGIIGHRFTFSVTAFGLTLIGFLGIKLMALLILSGNISRQEIGSLLSEPANRVKKQRSGILYACAAFAGCVMLAVAYYMVNQQITWYKPGNMVLALLLGIVGTVLVFYGMRIMIEWIVKKGKKNRQLHVFTFRQLQENIIYQSSTMAISALLIFAALCCFGAGVGIAVTKTSDSRIIDYTFEDSHIENSSEVFNHIQEVIKSNGLDDQFSKLFDVKIGHVQIMDDNFDIFNMESVMDALNAIPQSEDRDILLNNLSYTNYPYLICLSDYNEVLALAGKAPLVLAENEAAVYMDSEYTSASQNVILNSIFTEKPEVDLDGNRMFLTGDVQSVNFVADRSITLLFALIIPDDAFTYYTQGVYSTYVNGMISEQLTKENSLMNVYSELNDKLDATGIEYESYLKSVGRQLFYTVASSYITIYLALVFLVVANTIVGVQFLMSQQKTGRRYQTLIRLGASYETLCQSARKQINWFMGLPVLAGAISSMFGVSALFTGLLSSESRNRIPEMLIVSAAVIILLCVVEYIYMRMVKKSSDKYLLSLMQPQREE